MNNVLTAILAIVGAIITVAIISVIVSPRSQAPQVLAAGGSFLSRVISAAVDPSATAPTNGNPRLNAFSTPNIDPMLGLDDIGNMAVQAAKIIAMA